MPDYTTMTDDELKAELARLGAHVTASWAAASGELDRRSRDRASAAAESQANALVKATGALALATDRLGILTFVLGLVGVVTLIADHPPKFLDPAEFAFVAGFALVGVLFTGVLVRRPW